jgi:hypothetical protein
MVTPALAGVWREERHPDTLVVFLYLIVYNICLHRPNTMAVHLLRDPSVDDGRPVWIQLSTLTLRVQHRIGHPRREEEMVQCSITCTTPKTVTIRFRELGCRRKFSWRARRSVWIMVGVPTPSNGYYISIAALGIIPPHHLCIQSVEPKYSTEGSPRALYTPALQHIPRSPRSPVVTGKSEYDRVASHRHWFHGISGRVV